MPCPQQRYATGEPGKVQGRDRMGIVEGSCGYRTRGENSFYRETWVQDDGGRHVDKRSSDPRVAYPEVKVQVRDLVRVVGIAAPLCPTGCRYPVFSSPSEKMGTIDLFKVRLGAVRHGRARQSYGTGQCGDCRRVQGKFGLSRNLGYTMRGALCGLT